MNSIALPLAIIVGVVIYFIIVMFLPRRLLMDNNAFVKNIMQRLEDQQKVQVDNNFSTTPRGSANFIDSPLVRAFLFFPGAARVLPSIERAGLLDRLDKLVAIGMLALIILLVLTLPLGMLGVLLSFAVVLLSAFLYVHRARSMRSHEFLGVFPDALDVMVRSVRAGYPINAALGMVSDTMPNWIGDEFRRVVDEASYGWTLTEAVYRFADRIDEPDAQFFAVVLGVQQESGGNLAEILDNLSIIIRQRKNLRLKIRALSSEGRATAWILGLLPVFMLSVIYFMSPGHLNPLWESTLGFYVVGGVLVSLAVGVSLMRKIININI